MRLLHTSDWHLGHRLHGATREREHSHFLRWLVERCGDESIDALIIAGDIFDTANPSADAQRSYYEFLASCLRRRPQMDVVVIGGNHDSPARLDAVAEVLRPLRVHVVGALPRDSSGAIDLSRALIPLHTGGAADRTVAGWLVAIPYLRPTDWPVVPPVPTALAGNDGQRLPAHTADDLVAGLRQIYSQLFAAARRRKQPGQALLAVGHCLLAGGEMSAGSERRIQLGNSLPLPADLFPTELAYVALGHLHKAQQVDSPGHLRYSGSPIPLSFAERNYSHQVVIVELSGDKLLAVRPLAVPRWRQILSLPEQGPPLPLSQLLTQLQSLPRQLTAENDEPSDDLDRPLLEVRVRLLPGQPQPLLRTQIEEALAGATPQLLRIAVERSDSSDDEALLKSETPLLDLQPEEVFLRLYQRGCGDPAATVPTSQLALFRRLVEQVESGDTDAPAAAAGLR